MAKSKGGGCCAAIFVFTLVYYVHLPVGGVPHSWCRYVGHAYVSNVLMGNGRCGCALGFDSLKWPR